MVAACTRRAAPGYWIAPLRGFSDIVRRGASVSPSTSRTACGAFQISSDWSCSLTLEAFVE